MHRSTLLLASLNVAENLFILHLAVLRSLVNAWVKVVANLEARHARRISFNKLVIDILVDVDASAGMAGLAKVHIDAPGGPVDSFGNVGIGEDNVL